MNTNLKIIFFFNYNNLLKNLDIMQRYSCPNNSNTYKLKKLIFIYNNKYNN